MNVKPVEGVEGAFWIARGLGDKKLATMNLCPGKTVYGEALESVRGVEYRIWDPYRSKLAAYIMKDAKQIPIKKGSKILYLGAGAGTTASHISDMIGEEGVVYCIEFSQRALRELVTRLCTERSNIYPLLADARLPDNYPGFIKNVDGVYCDLAQPDQAKIMSDNAEIFLNKGDGGLIAIKARSINVSIDPKLIFKRELETLKRRGFEIIDKRRLEPFEKDHLMACCRFRTN